MTIMHDVATSLLTNVAAQIPDLADKRVCVYPGSEYPWDACECGSIAVYMTRMYHANTWPPSEVPDVDTCPPPYVVLEFSVVVLRCAPGSKNNGAPPDCTALDVAAERVFLDMIAMRIGISDAVTALLSSDTITEFALRDHNTVGPQGNCVGSQYNVSIGVQNDWRSCA